MAKMYICNCLNQCPDPDGCRHAYPHEELQECCCECGVGGESSKCFPIKHGVMVEVKDKCDILEEASSLINGDRAAQYGKPEDNFGRWLDLCRATGKTSLSSLTKADLALIMALGKIARESNLHKRDNIVDAVAYLSLYFELLHGDM